MTTPHAAAAKAIRKELKEKFPGEKISVRSESFAGGNAVRVYIGERIKNPEFDEYENPFVPRYYANKVLEEATNLVKKYQMGGFNGMEDIYEYDNRRDDLPQVKWVKVSALSNACY